jgi:KamA family protein
MALLSSQIGEAYLPATASPVPGERYRAYTRSQLDTIPQLAALPAAEREAMQAVSAVLPFRTNRYVLEELIDWSAVPEDPIFQLVFPQRKMLSPADLDRMLQLVRRDAPPTEVAAAARQIQRSLNPHPGGQRELNVPNLAGEPVDGLQHKYADTVLLFPAPGQTCHAYCTYCFRWAQFTNDADLHFAARSPEAAVRYLRAHTEVRSVLVTGGDPMVMKASVLRRFIEPLLDPALEHIDTIRIGTKAPAYWPQRFVSDDDADELLRLFEAVRLAGRQLALMAHYSHPRELESRVAERAVQRIRGTGAVVRCQAPIVRHVNDDADTWSELWRRQVRLGLVPYYMFVERDTGPKNYFEVPLARALRIFNDASRRIGGLGRTVRGPSMSTTAGKILVDGVIGEGAGRRFVLKFLNAREPSWVGRLFLAHYDEDACWIDGLRPEAGGEFFFEAELRERFGEAP